MPMNLQIDKGLYQKSERTMRSNFKVLKSWALKTTSVNVQYDAEQTEHYVQLLGKNMQSKALGSCECALLAKCEERENQQDATIRCLLSTSISTCFGHHYAHLQEIKDRVLLHMVYCAGSAECGW
jgi:hypothetical protein